MKHEPTDETSTEELQRIAKERGEAFLRSLRAERDEESGSEYD